MPETAEGVLKQPSEIDQVDAAAWVRHITERIVQNFDPLRIILFGSHARDEAGSESDIDLLVVLPHVTDKRQAAIDIRRALADLPVSKDIVDDAVVPQEHEEDD